MTKEEVEQELQYTKSKLEQAEMRNTRLELRLRIAHKVASVVLDEIKPLSGDNQLRQFISPQKPMTEEGDFDMDKINLKKKS